MFKLLINTKLIMLQTYMVPHQELHPTYLQLIAKKLLTSMGICNNYYTMYNHGSIQKIFQNSLLQKTM